MTIFSLWVHAGNCVLPRERRGTAFASEGWLFAASPKIGVAIALVLSEVGVLGERGLSGEVDDPWELGVSIPEARWVSNNDSELSKGVGFIIKNRLCLYVNYTIF